MTSSNQIVERYLRVLDMTLRQPEMDGYTRGQTLPPPSAAVG